MSIFTPLSSVSFEDFGQFLSSTYYSKFEHSFYSLFRHLISYHPNIEEKFFSNMNFCKTLTVKYISNIHLGPIRGMKCTQITESQQPPSHTWDDNFLCVPRNSPFNFEWSEKGPIRGKRCIEWREAADPDWRDNFLCRN